MNSHEVWQVEVQGHIYEANIEEIIEWIAEGSVMPDDKVRKGSLRWLKAEKVPELFGCFNSNLLETESTVVTTLTDASSLQKILENDAKDLEVKKPETINNAQHNPESPVKEKIAEKADTQFVDESPIATNACSVHPDLEARYFCVTCLTLFCKTCPESFGGKVKICIDCGGMCQIYTGAESVIRSVGAINKPYPKSEFDLSGLDNPSQKNFNFADFLKALAYPFKFKTSLILGAVMFMVLTLGQSAAAFGISMYFAAIVCFMLANTLVFGSLANTVDNFSRGKTKLNFMPGFDEFSTWDDVIHPFFLSLAVYSISFGILIVLVSGAIRYASDSESKIEAEKQRIISVVLPNAQNTLKSAAQIPQPNQLSPQQKPDNKPQSGNLESEDGFAQLQQNTAKQVSELQKLQQNVKQTVQAKIQTELGKNSELENEGFAQTAGTVMRLSLVYSVPIFLALLWGIFYFPVACAVAGYSRSFTSILNPAVCFDTVRRLGLDYFKIIGVFLILAASALVINAILQTVLSPLNLPLLGNLPAKALVSLFIFYLSIVFSVSLGTTLCRNSAQLNFRRG